MKGFSGRERPMLTDERFEALAAKYIDMVYRVAFGALKNREDAEDVTQEVLIKLYREKRDFESMEHVKRWLIRVTINPVSYTHLTLPTKRIV